MSKKSARAPAPPDYAGAATAQGAANLETARQQGYMNNPNIFGPLGNQTVTFGAKDQPTITQTLTPDATATLASQQKVERGLADLGYQGLQQASGLLGTPFAPKVPDLQTSLNMGGVPNAPISPGQTAYQALSSRMEPDIARADEALRTRLINQGLRPGGEAYNAEMDIAGRRATDARLQGAAQSIGLDQSARNQGYNEAVQSGQFANTAQQQALSQQLGLYQQPLNNIASLMSGTQLQMPQFPGYSGSNIAPPPIFDAARAQGQASMDAYGIQSANKASQQRGLYDLLGAGAMGAGTYFATPTPSDRRLKSNIERVGTHPLGIGVYEYDIFGERQRGVMADEVLTVKPEAVITGSDGYMMVDYAMLTPSKDTM